MSGTVLSLLSPCRTLSSKHHSSAMPANQKSKAICCCLGEELSFDLLLSLMLPTDLVLCCVLMSGTWFRPLSIRCICFLDSVLRLHGLWALSCNGSVSPVIQCFGIKIFGAGEPCSTLPLSWRMEMESIGLDFAATRPTEAYASVFSGTSACVFCIWGSNSFTWWQSISEVVSYLERSCNWWCMCCSTVMELTEYPFFFLLLNSRFPSYLFALLHVVN